jgi:hypothetical protein
MTPLSFALALYALGVLAVATLLLSVAFGARPREDSRAPVIVGVAIVAACWPLIVVVALLDDVVSWGADAVRRSK